MPASQRPEFTGAGQPALQALSVVCERLRGQSPPDKLLERSRWAIFAILSSYGSPDTSDDSAGVRDPPRTGAGRRQAAGGLRWRGSAPPT